MFFLLLEQVGLAVERFVINRSLAATCCSYQGAGGLPIGKISNNTG